MSGVHKGGLPISLAEVQSFVRVEGGDEEALLTGLLRSATAYCEQFLGLWLIERPFKSRVAASAVWQRLPIKPVRSVTSTGLVATDGTVRALSSADYEIDLDARGHAYVRLRGWFDERTVEVSGVAGLSEDANGLPEPIRQGLLRLTAHFYAHRDGTLGEPPAAVTALWRPYRAVQL